MDEMISDGFSTGNEGSEAVLNTDKLKKSTDSFVEFPFALAMKVDVNGRVEAVERALLHSIANVKEISKNQAVQLLVARNIAKGGSRASEAEKIIH
tara:strand:- start:23 stop:310 length:288 start_codon:yes stop_codon:yes gene_type:complete